MTDAARLSHLRAYLRQLGADLVARGEFSGDSDNIVEAAALAVLSGSGAALSQLWKDLGVVGREGATLAIPVIESFIGRLTRLGVSKVVDTVTRSRAEHAAEAQAQARREAGKAFMIAAKNLGKRPGT